MNTAGKRWIAFNFKAEKSGLESVTLKTTVADEESQSNAKKKSLPATRKHSFNFEQHLKPRTVSDLAVHSKKIKEVENWFKNNVVNKPSHRQTAAFLLITGPTGSGKTATVKVLSESLSISVTEYVTPVDHDFEVFRGPNQVVKFCEFLTESKWNSLFSSGETKIILVEEFPNSVIRSPQEFTNVLEDCYYKGNYPVIFICTDSFDNGNNVSQTLFPEEVINKYGICHINFNSCAPTLMKTALRRAHNLVQDHKDLFKTPSASTVEAIIATAMGDIRCAMNQYYFASILGTSDLPATLTKPSSNKRKRSETSCSIKQMFRDENLGLFHGLGRVLNPKRIQEGDSSKINCDFDKLVDEFSTQPGIFVSFLFENYIKYFGDLNDARQAAEILSFVQIFLGRWTDSRDSLIFGLWVSVMGLMVANGHKVSKWNQIKGPRKVKKKVNSDLETRNLQATDLFYYNLISKGRK